MDQESEGSNPSPATMIKYIPIIAAVLIVSGCGETLKSGTVIEKKHEDARTYEEYNWCKYRMPVTKTRSTYRDGKYVSETYTDWDCQGGYEQRFDDEDWKIHIKNCPDAGAYPVL